MNQDEKQKLGSDYEELRGAVHQATAGTMLSKYADDIASDLWEACDWKPDGSDDEGDGFLLDIAKTENAIYRVKHLHENLTSWRDSRDTCPYDRK